MYEFQKLENEEIIIISNKSILKVDNEERIISTILTNQRLLLFDDPSSINNYQETMRISRGANYIKQKEVILDVNLNDIVSIIEEEKYDKFILTNTNYFYLKDDKIKNEIIKIIAW